MYWLRVVLLVFLASALAPKTASANGRFPASINVKFIDGDNSTIFLPTTFGLLISKDDGNSFLWVCENAIGYGGTFDPDYSLMADGTVFATTFEGLRVSRDNGCTWDTIAGPLTDHWVGDVEVGPDGRVWAATSTGGRVNRVYVSDDAGQSFSDTGLSHAEVWWRSLLLAKSDGDRVYTTGFVPSLPAGDGMTSPDAVLYRTTNGGTSWEQLSTAQFVFGSSPQLMLAGISPTDPDTVFVRVVVANEPLGDALYRSTDGGTNWQKVLDLQDTIQGFLIDSSGTIFVGTVNDGVHVSTNGGADWTRREEPRMACINQRDDGDYFSCGANWDPDFFSLGRSSDGASWEKVVRFSEIAGPLSCPPGTIQFDVCESQRWPSLAEQFGIGKADAGPLDAAGPPDAKGGGGNKGCGGCGVAMFAFFPLFPWRPRRGTSAGAGRARSRT